MLSTKELEYVAATEATREAVWLRKLSGDLGPHCNKLTVLFIDNQSVIRVAKNSEFHKLTKHIEAKYRYIREKVESCEISVEFVPTERADIFTKAAPRVRFNLCDILGLTSRMECSNGENVK